MSKFLIGCGVLLAIVGIPLLIVASAILGTYNTAIVKGKEVDTAWAQVETQYQRRFDLIPNVTNAVKGFLVQERTILESIAEARTRYASAESGSPEKVQAQGQLDSALARLLVVVENYPNLKSDATVQSLIDELAGTENRINVARIRYNEVANEYNTYIAKFPASLIAGVFNFREKALYKSAEGADKAPVVDLNVETNESTK